MLKQFNRIANLGISAETPISLQNKLRVFNSALFVVFLISAFYFFLSFVFKYHLSTWVTIYSLASSLLSLYLVSIGRYRFSFHFALAYGFIFLSLFSYIFGRVTYSYLYFLFVPIACNVLFDDKRTINFYFVLAIVVMTANVIFMDYVKPYYEIEFSDIWLGYPNIAFMITLIFLTVRMFKLENRRFADRIEEQRAVLEQKNEEITDSINYARRIQNVLLAPEILMKENLPEYFVLYQPKDIVSGDFYWAAKEGHKFWLCVGDCTGHGVPGAFMSLLNISILRELIVEQKIQSPDAVLNKQRDEIIRSLNPDGAVESGKDGMDCALLCFDQNMSRLRFSGANNSIWIIRKGELMECRGDKQPIGLHEGETQNFKVHEFELQEGDVIYAMTDGFADQFGGPRGKKFKYAQLKESIASMQVKSLSEQEDLLHRIFNEWKGDLEQVDDVLVIGVRV